MLKIIIAKEIKETLGTIKFGLTFGLCAIMIILAFYIGARNYQVQMRQYEAAKAENMRQMEGITDWAMIKHHVILPPSPLHALVNGISYDVGRNVEMFAVGELQARDSRFSQDPVYAIFKFLDLNFIFQVVLALFAILFGYNMVNGEKEAGTLRLIFANPIAKDKFILGKLLGAFFTLGIPLLIPFLFGFLILLLIGIPLTGSEWIRLSLICLGGLIYFGFFLNLTIFVSSRTHKSATSFLWSLIIWISLVFIVPPLSVIIGGRSVDVPSIDEIASQKYRYRSQLWQEDVQKMNEFKSPENSEPHEMMKAFQKFMSELAEKRNEKINTFNEKLNQDRSNRQIIQQNVSLGISRISPSAVFGLAATKLAGTSIELISDFFTDVREYQNAYKQFLTQKTDGMLPGAGLVLKMISIGDEEPEPIDAYELPEFEYAGPDLSDILNRSAFDLTLLIIFCMIFFIGTVFSFQKYDVR